MKTNTYQVKVQNRATSFAVVTINAANAKEASIAARFFGVVYSVEIVQTPQVKPTSANLFSVESAQNWKSFVAGYVVLQTKKKLNREMIGGYQVCQTAKGYTIKFNGCSLYPNLTAENLYSWMQRLPLIYFANEADHMRHEILKPTM